MSFVLGILLMTSTKVSHCHTWMLENGVTLCAHITNDILCSLKVFLICTMSYLKFGIINQLCHDINPLLLISYISSCEGFNNYFKNCILPYGVKQCCHTAFVKIIF